MRKFHIHRDGLKYIIYNPSNGNKGSITLKVKGEKILFEDFSPNGPIATEKGLGSNAELAVLDDVVERLGTGYVLGHPSPTLARVNHLKKFRARGGTWLNLCFMVYENIDEYRKKLRSYVEAHSGIEIIWREPGPSDLYTVMAERAQALKKRKYWV